MKPWRIAGILAVAVSLWCSTTGYAWYVSRQLTDWDEYDEKVGEGSYAESKYGGPFRANITYADVYAEIEGEEQNCAGGAYAYVYWTDTILGYDPEWDPPLLAQVSSEVYTWTYAQYDLEDSEYDTSVAATGYASGYSASAYVQISEPDAGDVDGDWFDEDIDIYENGYPIYLEEFAYAAAQTLTTEQKVKASAYATSETTCVVIQNP